MTDLMAGIRAEILRDPSVVLDDPELMRALLEENDAGKGANVVDLRGIFVDRLEARLDRLEDTHRGVIAAAYENLAGTNQIHRAILALLDAQTFDEFLHVLDKDVANILAVDVIRLCLETPETGDGEPLRPDGPLNKMVVVLPEQGVAAYVTGGRNNPARHVTLRVTSDGAEAVFGPRSIDVQSEALLRLGLGQATMPGLIALGSSDPKRFSPDQGTDLLVFFSHAVERILRRWVT